MENGSNQHYSFGLSERKRSLIERLYDGECSFFARLRAELLVKNNLAAKDYFESLSTLSDCLFNSDVEKSQLFSSSTSDADLFSRIEARIDEEERASLFLGKRELDPRAKDAASQSQGSFWGFITGPFVAAGDGLSASGLTFGKGMAGALACSALLVVGVTQYGGFGVIENSTPDRLAADGVVPLEGGSEPLRITSVNPVPVELVSSRMNTIRGGAGMPLTANTFDKFAFDDLYSSSPQIQFRQQPRPVDTKQPVFVSRNLSPSVEVDWMRSDGRVRILSGPKAQAPIIFVKKRRPVSVYRRRAVGNTASNSNGIVIQERAIPSATFARR